ncbi:ATP-grasp domain-containing protein [Serinibacter salmoneus]|uniref:D-aspartate ligase n=1 Tax=Serinibacter salmoneus TaxID=556530 RepID=A0A2A9CZZ2_9MICO|nr:ATP-grasp domain-containing protein [Serinibacter salmoneus]PFG19575.1 D-aspartate ligase [Serinibacter salmoneus]
MTLPPVRPIVLGGDIGAYATARTFHERYGVRSVVLAGVATGPVRDSVAVDLRITDGLDEPAGMLAALRAVVAEQPGAQHLVLASADWRLATLLEVREELEAGPGHVLVPYASREIVTRVGDKAALAHACAELGVATPATLVVEPGSAPAAADLPADFPLIVKPASTAAAHEVSYPGQAKVHTVHDLAALHDLLARMGAAGMTGQVCVQERVPGADDAMAAVNVFLDPDGAVRFAQLGRVLLEEHTPTALGNSVAQVTVPGSHPGVEQVLEDVIRVLRHLGMTGFANVDLKRDAEGTYRVLEVNPRVGRSGYAVTASGYDIAEMYVNAYLEKVPAQRITGEHEHLFTVVPLAVLHRYAPDSAALVRRLRRAGAVTNPLYYRAERHPRRWAWIAVAMVNQARKFARHS